MARSAADIAHKVLDPVLAKRAGLSMALVDAWPQIAGTHLCDQCMPVKINWPRRVHQDDPFEPGVLVIAAEAFAALHIQHQTGEMLSRVNAYMGFEAVDRIRIVQKSVAAQTSPSPPQRRELSMAEKARLDEMADGFEDDGLAKSIRQLGTSVLAQKQRT